MTPADKDAEQAARGGKKEDVLLHLNSQTKSSGVLLGPDVDPAQEDYTVVMFGVPRGGTTMVAGLVQRLGIPIGEGMDYNLEDPDFARKPLPQMKQSLQERNEAFRVWGWKFPAAARYLPKIIDTVRNPRFIVVWRDPLTAALRGIDRAHRKNASKEAQFKESLGAIEAMIGLQLLNVEAIRRAGCPVLMISYEKAVRRPEEMIRLIATFVGRPAPEDLSELLEFAKPESYK